jgi:hypothetical protein
MTFQKKGPWMTRMERKDSSTEGLEQISPPQGLQRLPDGLYLTKRCNFIFTLEAKFIITLVIFSVPGLILALCLS